MEVIHRSTLKTTCHMMSKPGSLTQSDQVRPVISNQLLLSKMLLTHMSTREHLINCVSEPLVKVAF